MKTLELSSDQLKTLQSLVSNDIEDLANEPEFFEQTDNQPKEYIDKQIKLAELFDLDFWKVVDLHCSNYAFDRLKALYEGMSINDFIETYDMPTEKEQNVRFMKALLKGTNPDKKE